MCAEGDPPDRRRNGELIGDWKRFFTTDQATHVVTETAVRRALTRRYARAPIELLRRHLVDITRPRRRKLGVDTQSWARFRARFH